MSFVRFRYPVKFIEAAWLVVSSNKRKGSLLFSHLIQPIQKLGVPSSVDSTSRICSNSSAVKDTCFSTKRFSKKVIQQMKNKYTAKYSLIVITSLLLFSLINIRLFSNDFLLNHKCIYCFVDAIITNLRKLFIIKKVINLLLPSSLLICCL